jgi:hypothetical protein
VTKPEDDDRRKDNRRLRLLRNIFSYFNRRNLFRRGRRKDEEEYDGEPDWFERERNKGK